MEEAKPRFHGLQAVTADRMNRTMNRAKRWLEHRGDDFALEILGEIEAQQLVGWYFLEAEFGLAGARQPVVAENAEKGRDSEAGRNGGGGHGALEGFALAFGRPRY